MSFDLCIEYIIFRSAIIALKEEQILRNVVHKLKLFKVRDFLPKAEVVTWIN